MNYWDERIEDLRLEREERVASTALMVRETPEPSEGTENSIWPQVADFWNDTYGATFFSPRLAELTWVCSRCIQLNAQQISSMPLRFTGTYEPAWVSSPDPNWYPNGIGDAVFAIVEGIYGWGFAILQVTSRYASGLPQTWTVLDSEHVTIKLGKDGRRHYFVGENELDRADIVQIDRNPGNRLHGTSPLKAYASQARSVISSGELGQSIMSGGVPTSVIKSQRKLNQTQAQAIQTQWAAAMARRGGLPAVLPPELDFETLSFSPKDLLLLEGQEFNARVLGGAYGVPAHMLNLPLSGGLTYQNPQMLGEQWWRFELRTTAKRIHDALTAQLLPRGNWVLFDATDTFAELTSQSQEDDPQGSVVANASPAQQDGAAVTPLRPKEAVA